MGLHWQRCSAHLCNAPARERAKGSGRDLQEELALANVGAVSLIEIVAHSLTRFRSGDYLSLSKV